MCIVNITINNWQWFIYISIKSMEVFRNLYYYSHRVAHSFEMAFWRRNGCVAVHDYYIVYRYASYTTILLNRHIDIIYRHTYATSDLLAVPCHRNTFNIALTRLKIVLSAWCVTNINAIRTHIPLMYKYTMYLFVQ